MNIDFARPSDVNPSLIMSLMDIQKSWFVINYIV